MYGAAELSTSKLPVLDPSEPKSVLDVPVADPNTRRRQRSPIR